MGGKEKRVSKQVEGYLSRLRHRVGSGCPPSKFLAGVHVWWCEGLGQVPPSVIHDISEQGRLDAR